MDLSKILKSKISFIDIGSRWGLLEKWEQIGEDNMEIVLFEPDKSEFNLLRKKYPKSRIFKKAISDKVGFTHFFKTQEPGKSSILFPNHEFIQRFENYNDYRIKSQKKIEMDNLFNILRKNSINPDAIKIDAQGMSFEILKGLKSKIRDLVWIEFESEFHEFYKNQKVFSDIDLLLKKQGFELLDLNKHWYKYNRQILGRGQVTFADFIYIKKIEDITHLNIDKYIKLLYLLINFNYVDVAYFIYKKFDNNFKIEQKTQNILKNILKSESKRNDKLNKFIKFLLKINNSILIRLSKNQKNWYYSNYGNDSNSIDFR